MADFFAEVGLGRTAVVDFDTCTIWRIEGSIVEQANQVEDLVGEEAVRVEVTGVGLALFQELQRRGVGARAVRLTAARA